MYFKTLYTFKANAESKGLESLQYRYIDYDCICGILNKQQDQVQLKKNMLCTIICNQQLIISHEHSNVLMRKNCLRIKKKERKFLALMLLKQQSRLKRH